MSNNAVAKVEKVSKPKIEKIEVAMKTFHDLIGEYFDKYAKVSVDKNVIKLSLAKIAPKKKAGADNIKNPQLHFTITFAQENLDLFFFIKPRGGKEIIKELLNATKAADIKKVCQVILETIREESLERSQKFYQKNLGNILKNFEGAEEALDNKHFTDMDSDIYHKCPGESRSALVKLEKSYLEYEYYKNKEMEPSVAMRKGSAFHATVLEEHRFEEEVYVNKASQGRKTLTTQEKALAEIIGVGRAVINEKQYEEVLGGKKALYANPIAKALVDNSRTEESFFWSEEHAITKTKTLFKCRPDGLIIIDKNKHKDLLELLAATPSIAGTIKNALLEDGDAIMFDVKFTQDLSEKQVTKSAFDYGYFFQVAHYSKGVETVLGTKVKLFFAINVHSKAPFDCSVDLFDESCISVGEAQREAAINTLSFHRANPEAYKGVNDEVRVLSVPEWMLVKTSDHLTQTKGTLAKSLMKKKES